MASWVLSKDLKQPSGRIVGKAAMVVMNFEDKSEKVGVEFWMERTGRISAKPRFCSAMIFSASTFVSRFTFAL
jgi:hypothetical protein